MWISDRSRWFLSVLFVVLLAGGWYRTQASLHGHTVSDLEPIGFGVGFALGLIAVAVESLFPFSDLDIRQRVVTLGFAALLVVVFVWTVSTSIDPAPLARYSFMAGAIGISFLKPFWTVLSPRFSRSENIS
ncbi:hypothetical protein ACNS7O_03900 [Haloferacaceae archaeon DSL9]